MVIWVQIKTSTNIEYKKAIQSICLKKKSVSDKMQDIDG